MFHLTQAIIGFIAEPSFATGPGAPTVQILGMDYNGWHALAGLALFGPGLVFCLRKSWSVLYLLAGAVAGGLPASGPVLPSGRLRVHLSPPQHHRCGRALRHRGGVMAGVAVIQIRLDGGLRRSLADLRRQ